MDKEHKAGRSVHLAPSCKLLAILLWIACLGPATAAQTAAGPIKVFILAGQSNLEGQGVVYSKIPKLQFPVDQQGRAFLVQNVTCYSKEALFDAFRIWRDGGPACSGKFYEKGAWKPRLNTHTTRYDQAGFVPIVTRQTTQ